MVGNLTTTQLCHCLLGVVYFDALSLVAALKTLLVLDFHTAQPFHCSSPMLVRLAL